MTPTPRPDRFPAPTLAFLALLGTILLGSLVPAVAKGDQRIKVHPSTVTMEGEPFELVFVGEWFYFFDDGGPQPQVAVDGDVISVTVRAFYPLILPPTSRYAFGAEIPPLDEDVYEVRLMVDDEVIDSGFLQVFPRRLAVEPVLEPLLDGDKARILVSGFGRCPLPDPVPVEVRDEVIRLKVPVSCVSDPPQPFEVTVETPALPAGDYRVVVYDAFAGDPFEVPLGTGRLAVEPPVRLQDDRFTLDLQWTDSKGQSGPARPVVQSEDSVLYHFFGGDNWELQAKVLDGCGINDHYWVFTAASTDVAWELRVADQLAGTEWTGSNPLGERSRAITDVTAFPCDVPEAVAAASSTAAVDRPWPRLHPPEPPVDWLETSTLEDPLPPHDREEITLWLWGTSPTCCDDPRVLDTELDADARRVTVTLAAPGGPLEQEEEVEVGIDLGRLDSGGWTVDVLQIEGHDPRRILEREIFVREGYEIVSPLENVGQPVEGVPLDLAVVGPGGRCADLDLAGVEDPGSDGEAGLIHLAIREPETCNTLVPPGPFRGAVHVGALEAGVYQAVLARPDLDGRIELEREIEVLPDPLELGDGRYEVSVRWTAFDGLSGKARPAFPPSEDSAVFWFFGPENWELMVKVLDGCDVNGHVWVFGAASTNVEYAIEVKDTLSGATWTYVNPLGEASPAITDTGAFACLP